YSDFIYAIIIEETGIVGGLAVLVLYIWFFFRVKRIVKRCDRTFPAFLAIGLAVNILYQAFMHMGVAVGVFPVTGQTLPFVSMGGSSLLFTGMSFGIILRISREVERRKEKSLQETTGDEPAAGPDPIPNVEYEQATV
ncbi:MAG: FtsW/RodA/SpoVE family cell cycle protein, partial [Bacteroidales bacterium]|nr:FtsW/RodA/SpoVE family cell cycle protein [Bacteroidales bacterium]